MFKINNLEFKSSGLSILETIITEGYSIPYNCRDGRCRNCEIVNINSGQKVLACQTKAIDNSHFTSENFSDIALPKSQNIPVKLLNVKKKGCFFEIYLKYSKNFKFDYLRGQHINIFFGEFERSYSIYEINEKENYIKLLISPVKYGKATTFFCNKNINTFLRVEIPLGNFTFRNHTKTSERSVFICTGSGITPVLNMFNSKDLPSNVTIYWGVRKYCEKVSEVCKFFKNSINVYLSQEPNMTIKNHGRITFANISEKELINNWYLVGNPEMILNFSKNIIKLSNKPNVFKDPFV